MYPDPLRKPFKQPLNKQGGLGLPVAIFVVVVMALVAVAVGQLSATGAQVYAQNLLSIRAFYAAESGAQLKTADVLSATPCACGAANQTYTFTVSGLSSCNANVTCSELTVNAETYCTLSSRGRCDGTSAERTVEVRVK